MAEELKIAKGTKADKYKSIIKQIEALIDGESNITANLANISAALRQTFNFFWVGFYVVDSANELVLGPFQGDVACTRITKGKGVCGTAWKQQKTIIVPNVDDFEGHIACSSLSKSEIVVPVYKNHKVELILDIDSDQLDDFDETDKIYLEELSEMISNKL
jgi:GAF domain-containing protein